MSIINSIKKVLGFGVTESFILATATEGSKENPFEYSDDAIEGSSINILNMDNYFL